MGPPQTPHASWGCFFFGWSFTVFLTGLLLWNFAAILLMPILLIPILILPFILKWLRCSSDWMPWRQSSWCTSCCVQPFSDWDILRPVLFWLLTIAYCWKKDAVQCCSADCVGVSSGGVAGTGPEEDEAWSLGSALSGRRTKGTILDGHTHDCKAMLIGGLKGFERIILRIAELSEKSFCVCFANQR